MTLAQWLATLADELELDGVTLDADDLHTILDLARDAAHAIQRPAAPLTTFLVGVAVGRGIPLERAAAVAAAAAARLDRHADADQD